MTGRQLIVDTVLQVLRTLVPRGVPIKENNYIIADLKLLSDDATAMAIDVQRRLGIKIPLNEWNSVYTVEDVINLCEKYSP
jgi:acyl carrier protein